MNPGWNIILAASNIHIFDIVDLYLLDFVAQGGFLACRPEGQDWLNKISSLPSIASIIQGLVLKRKFETHFSWPRPVLMKKVSVKVGPILMAGLLWPKAMEWCYTLSFSFCQCFQKRIKAGSTPTFVVVWVWSQWVGQPAFLTSFMFTSGGFNQFWGECFRDWGFWTLPLGHLSLTGTMTNHCNVFLLLNTTFENCVKGLTFVEDHYYLLLCSAVCVKIWFVVHVFAADSINKQTGKDHEQMVHCRRCQLKFYDHILDSYCQILAL